MAFNTLSDFYRSRTWEDFRGVLMLERTNEEGLLICEHCGRPITARRDCIAHHKEALTLENVNDANIALHPENISLVHMRCHNDIHHRFGSYGRHVYLVYGSPLSGKSSYVRENAGLHDLVVDIDKICACITNNPFYIKSGRLYDNMRSVHDALLRDIKYKNGKWVNAFIVGGYPFKGERERLCAELGAEPIYIECTKEEALARLQATPDGRNKQEWTKFIDTWFQRFQE